MSAITFALTRPSDKAPPRRFARVGKQRCRQEAFRIALDHYIAEYQKHHAVTTGDVSCDAGQTRFARFHSFAGLFGR